ncbi:hypothetical protein LCGC14_1654260 [marine sediment metagenome]|uniref:Uncharacterized protein n=1 Tax=marine sediment metagenome TaxID=412755 RepID=A0A0F9KBW1_9ZZZZ
MSMSTGVILLRDKDDPQYQYYLKVLNSCIEAKVPLPDAVDRYFGGQGTSNDPDFPLEIDFEVTEWKKSGQVGIDIDLDKIPKGVKTIRFYNSW